MYCKECGVSVYEGQKFCTNCGACLLSPEEIHAAAAPAPMTRRRALRPYWFLLGLFLIGLVVFMLLPLPSGAVPQETQPSMSDRDNRDDRDDDVRDDRDDDDRDHRDDEDQQDRDDQDDGFTASGNWFTLENGELTFLPENYSGGNVLYVPDRINDIPVTKLSDRCFYDCDDITTILLPDTLISIGNEAFAECDDLRGLFVPDSVVSIGDNAFTGCLDMESIYVPNSVNRIGQGAFEDCPALRFIFYSGMYEEFETLYSDMITPFTWVSSLDGDFRHGAQN